MHIGAHTNKVMAERQVRLFGTQCSPPGSEIVQKFTMHRLKPYSHSTSVKICHKT